MRELPIPFRSEMVRALLAGTKTQTRRLPDIDDTSKIVDFVKVATDVKSGRFVYEMKDKHGAHVSVPAGRGLITPHFSPRYAVGDHLYVREHWRTTYGLDWTREDLGRPLRPSEFDPATTPIEYLADGERELGGKDRRGLHMPKWASRIALIVEDVRVERLQSISAEDAIAEGIEKQPYTGSDPQFQGMFAWKDYSDHPYAVAGYHHLKPVLSYQSLWDKINGQGAWSANPWVVAYTFRVIEGNIAQIGGAS